MNSNLQSSLNLLKNIKIGDKIYFYYEYNILFGTVLKVNANTMKLDIPAQHGLIHHQKNMEKKKIIPEHTPAILIWETWKGKNGRGGYRNFIISSSVKTSRRNSSLMYINRRYIRLHF